MLLIDFWNSKIEKDKRIKRAVKRDIREDLNDVIDYKIISIPEIEFFNIANIVTCKIIDKINNVIKDEINNIIVAEIAVNFFACFVRI